MEPGGEDLELSWAMGLGPGGLFLRVCWAGDCDRCEAGLLGRTLVDVMGLL